jgi:predicted dehydrogenase
VRVTSRVAREGGAKRRKVVEMTKREPFRVLLVGAGEQGWESRGPAIKALENEGVVLAGIADPDPDRLRSTARLLEVDPGHTYSRMEDALDSAPFHGVVICAPDRFHEELTIRAIEAGCHVLCEKPMALDAAGGRRMIDASRNAGKVLVIGYQYPWMHRGLADLADAGMFDSVFEVSAKWLRSGPIPPGRRWVQDDLLGHLLSVVQTVVRSTPVRVLALGSDRFFRRLGDVELEAFDTLRAIVQYEDQTTAHLVVAWDRNASRDESIEIEFSGHEVSAEVPIIGREREVELFKPRINQRVGDARLVSTLDKPLPVQTEETFVHQTRDWIDAARGRTPEPRYPAEEALAVQVVLDATSASARARGEWTEVIA